MSSRIVWECECGRRGRTKAANAGRKLKCPDCDARIVIGDSDPEFDDWYEEDFGDSGPALPARLPKQGRRKKKPKKPSAAEPQGTRPARLDKSTRLLIALGSVVGVCVLIGFISYLVSSYEEHQEQITKVPERWEDFQFPDGGFACEFPEGWEIRQGGGRGSVPPFVKFSDGDIRIEVRAGVSGSILNMPAQALGRDNPNDELAAVQAAHRFRREQLVAGTDGYTESDPDVVDTAGMGPSLIARFEKKVLLDHSYGYRATVCGSMFQYNVTLVCPKDRVEIFRPAVEHVVSTMTDEFR